MPFRFDCPTSSCEQSFDVASDALAHARRAHPGEALPAQLPGSFRRQGIEEGSTLRTRCRSCAVEISIVRGSEEIPRCEPCSAAAPTLIPDPEEGQAHAR